MENKPLVSVLLPVYNCELYINEAVDSVLNQTFRDFELIIIDDCSTDATLKIIKSYQDNRILIVEKEQNSGITNSLNYGISIAKGKYIARMDGDDICLPERFAKQVDFLENNLDVVLCGTQYKIIGKDKIITVPEYHEDIKHAMLESCSIGHPTVMMRKSALDQLPFVYNTEKEPAEDYDLWIRLLHFGKLHNLQEVLLHYRVHENQVSRSSLKKQQLVAIDVRFDLLKNINYNFSEQEETLYKKSISNVVLFNSRELSKLLHLLSKLKNIEENSFFKNNQLVLFFNTSETKFINKYFLNRQHFSPVIFFQYSKINGKLRKKLSRREELKLLIKSLLFFNSK